MHGCLNEWLSGKMFMLFYKVMSCKVKLCIQSMLKENKSSEQKEKNNNFS